MGKRPSVLIVESRQSTRTTLEMSLSHEGLRVFSAAHLDSALLQLRVLQPDLIIIGFDRQGLEASTAVAQIKALSRAPLLAFEAETGAAPAQGIADTLLYPLHIGQLCAKIADLLGERCLQHAP